MVNRFLCLVVSFLVVFVFTTFSTPKNSEVVAELSRKISRKIIELMINNQVDSVVCVSIEKHSLKHFFENFFYYELNGFGYRINQNDSNSKLSLVIYEYEIDYSNLPNSEKVNRKIKLSVVGHINSKKSFVFPFSFTEYYSDEIEKQDIRFLEENNDLFSGKDAENRDGFFKKYIEPIVVVSASALVVILFFTIRSR